MPLGNEPQPVSASLDAAELDTGEELERYWGDIKRRIAAMLRQEGVGATAAGELAILPGLDEVLALVRLKRYHDEGRYDVLIIDSAPTGAAMRLLSAPDLSRWYAGRLLGLSRGLARIVLPSVRSLVKVPVGEEAITERITDLVEQVEALRTILCDSAVTSVRLVMNPDHLSLQETQRAYTYMNLFGLSVDALLVNRILPDHIQDPFFETWKTSQAEHRRQAQELFAPLPVFEVPLMQREVVGVEALAALAQGVYGDRDPVPPLANEQPLRFYVEGERYMLALRITGVSGDSVEVGRHGDELHVRLGHFRRTLVLPQYLSGLDPTWAQVEGDYLKVAFEQA